MPGTDPYMGYHRRMDGDYYGCLFFLVFTRSGAHYWVSMDTYDNEHGFYEGPFNSAKEAYYDAVNQE